MDPTGGRLAMASTGCYCIGTPNPQAAEAFVQAYWDWVVEEMGKEEWWRADDGTAWDADDPDEWVPVHAEDNSTE